MQNSRDKIEPAPTFRSGLVHLRLNLATSEMPVLSEKSYFVMLSVEPGTPGTL